MAKTFTRLHTPVFIDSTSKEPMMNVSIDESKYVNVRSSKDIPGNYIEFETYSSTIDKWNYYDYKSTANKTGEIVITYTDSTKAVVLSVEYRVLVTGFPDYPTPSSTTSDYNESPFGGQIHFNDNYDYGQIVLSENLTITPNMTGAKVGKTSLLRIVPQTYSTILTGFTDVGTNAYDSASLVENTFLFGYTGGTPIYSIILQENVVLIVQMDAPVLTVESNGSTALSVTLDANVNGVELYMSLTSNGSYSLIETIVAGELNANDITGLNVGDTRYFKAIALGDGTTTSNSEMSLEYSGTTEEPSVQLTAPTIGIPTPASGTAIDVPVSGVDINATFLKLEYKLASSAIWLIDSATLPINTTTKQVTGLSMGGQYDFQWTALGSGNYTDSLPSNTAYTSTTYNLTKSLSLNNTKNYPALTMPNNYSLNNGTTGVAHSWNVWVRPTAYNTANIYIYRGSSNGGTNELICTFNSTTILFSLYADNTNFIRVSHAGTIPLDEMSMLTYTYTGGNTGASLKIYLNSVLLTTTDASSGTFAYPVFRGTASYGNYANANPYGLTGQLSNVVEFTKELTQSEITKMYNEGRAFNLLTSNVASYIIGGWLFDNSLADIKTTNPLTAIGTIVYSSTVPAQ